MLLAAGCASLPAPQDLDREALAVITASFRDQGIAKVDRIAQDLGLVPEISGHRLMVSIRLLRADAEGRYKLAHEDVPLELSLCA